MNHGRSLRSLLAILLIVIGGISIAQQSTPAFAASKSVLAPSIESVHAQAGADEKSTVNLDVTNQIEPTWCFPILYNGQYAMPYYYTGTWYDAITSVNGYVQFLNQFYPLMGYPALFSYGTTSC